MPRLNAKSKIILNVYDLHYVNDYTYYLGVGVFHSGVEINGTEWTFGGHPFNSTGVFQVEPREAPGAIFREAIVLEEVEYSQYEIERIIQSLKGKFTGISYNILTRNCNHFSNELVSLLSAKNQGIPGWCNRLAWLGGQPMINCLLPPSWGLQTPSNPQISETNEQRQPFIPYTGQGQALQSAVANTSSDDDTSNIREKAAAAAMKRLLAADEADEYHRS